MSINCNRKEYEKENIYVGRSGRNRQNWTNRKGVRQDCIMPPCLFNLYAEYIMRNAGLEEAQARIKIARRKSITSDMQTTPSLWQKVKRN